MRFSETVTWGAPHPGTDPEVLSTPAGYYIGFRCEDGMPYSRESGYFASHDEATSHLESYKRAIAISLEEARKLPFVRDTGFAGAVS